MLGRELGRGRDLDLLDVPQRALGERREPAQRLDLDVEHVDPHRALLGRREHVQQAAAQRELPALLDLLDALVARRDELGGALVEVEQLAHAQRERVRAQRRVGHLLRQRHRADHDHRRLELVGVPSRGQQRVERRDAQADQVRRRREVRLVGDAARGVVAHPPRRQPGAQVGRQVARGAVVADDHQRRARARGVGPMSASAAIRYGRSEADTNAWPPSRARRWRRRVLLDQPQQRAQRHPALLALLRAEHAALAPPLDAARSISSATSAWVSRKRPSTYAETISGSVRVGPPDADAHAHELRAAELALERLQPVVPGQPAAQARAHLAERQVDLVVHDEHALQRQLAARRAPGPTERPASFM